MKSPCRLGFRGSFRQTISHFPIPIIRKQAQEAIVLSCACSFLLLDGHVRIAPKDIRFRQIMHRGMWGIRTYNEPFNPLSESSCSHKAAFSRAPHHRNSASNQCRRRCLPAPGWSGATLPAFLPTFPCGVGSVSYTHLDVYKRQVCIRISATGNVQKDGI